MIYFGGNFFYATALWYAPASLVATLLASLLPVNIVLSRLLLNEPLDRYKVVGSSTVLVHTPHNTP